MGMVRGYATALEMYDSAVAEGFTGAEISLRLDRFQEAGAAIEAALKPLYARLEKADALAEVVTAADDYGYWWCGVCVHDEPGESRDTIPHRDDCRLADYRRTEGR